MYREIMDRLNSVMDKAEIRIQSEFDDWMDLYHEACCTAASMENNGYDLKTEQDYDNFFQKYTLEVESLEGKYENLLQSKNS